MHYYYVMWSLSPIYFFSLTGAVAVVAVVLLVLEHHQPFYIFIINVFRLP